MLPQAVESVVPNQKSCSPTVDSKKLEYGLGVIYASVPSSLGFGVGQSYSNFLASTVGV